MIPIYLYHLYPWIFLFVRSCFEYFSSDKKICLNRGKLGKDLFKRKIVQSTTQIERKNLNRLLKTTANDEILCDDGKKYQLEDLCKTGQRGRISREPKLCYISEIGLEIDLYVYLQFNFHNFFFGQILYKNATKMFNIFL